MCTSVGMAGPDMLNTGTVPCSKKRAPCLKPDFWCLWLGRMSSRDRTISVISGGSWLGLQTSAVMYSTAETGAGDGPQPRDPRNPDSWGGVRHRGSCGITSLRSHSSYAAEYKLKDAQFAAEMLIALCHAGCLTQQNGLGHSALGIKTQKPRVLIGILPQFNLSASNSPSPPHICPEGWVFNVAMFWKCSKCFVLNPIWKYLTVKQMELFLLLCKANVICIEFLALSANRILLSDFIFPFLWRQGCWGGSWTQQFKGQKSISCFSIQH